MKNVEELDLYKEYKFAYDKAHELEFFDKLQENDFALVTIQKILVLKTSAPIPEQQERNIKTENWKK